MFNKINLVLIVLAFIVGCTRFKDKSDNISIHLNTLNRDINIRPDSILNVLDSVFDPYVLNEEDFNKYLLLKIQAKDKSNKSILNDTAIFEVKSYYLSNDLLHEIALSSFYCGRVLHEQHKYKQAIREFLFSKKYAELANYKSLMGLTESAIGAIFLEQFMGDEALKHFYTAVNSFKNNEDKRNEIVTYNQIGNAFLINSFGDSALFYYNKGLDLAMSQNDSTQIANIRQCIGVAYRCLGKLDLAINYLKLADNITLDCGFRNKLNHNLSKVYLQKKMLDSSEYYIERSLNLCGSSDPNFLASNYKALASISEKRNKCSESLDYYKKYVDCIENIIDENQNLEILELKNKYLYELYQNENNVLKIKQQKLLLVISFCLIVLSIFLILYYYKTLSSKRFVLDQERKIYQLIEMSNEYYKTNDSLRVTLFHHFDILKKAALLKQYLKKNDEQDSRLCRKVNEIIYGQEDLDWDLFYQEMNKINEGLFEKIKVKYSSLDPIEFKVCCLTYIGLSCSEIGVILNLSPNTIQMKRNSIRKKMMIKPQGNIKDYIDSIF